MAIGIAYRPELRIELFTRPQSVDYLEITAEHYLDLRGTMREDLDALRATFPLVVHALGLSIGSADGVDPAYLERLARLIEYVRAPWWSDHLAFTRAGGIDVGHFIPLRRDDASIEIVARNAATVRTVIGTPFALENPAVPFIVPGGQLTEGTFLRRTAQAADCRLLLDLENVHANECNGDELGEAVIDAIPPQWIAEIHIAGGRYSGHRYIDSHDAPVPQRTWDLLAYASARGEIGAITLERDAKLSNLAGLECDLQRARRAAIECSPARTRSATAGRTVMTTATVAAR